jgi:hypothetical protein
MTKPLTCPACGQRGDQPPGLRLGEFEHLEAVFAGDEAVPTPQRVECHACYHAWAVARGSIDVRRAS